MGRPTQHERAIVLHRNRLRESDAIVDALIEDGSRISFVARGALKPSNPFAARLDLFGVCDVMLAPSRGLAIVSEARLAAAHAPLRSDIIRNAAAAPILDALRRCAHEDLPVPRLFPMTESILDHLSTCEEIVLCPLTAAYLLKLFALLGFRPSLDTCIDCGQSLLEDNPTDEVRFSYIDGGALCYDCAASHVHVALSLHTLNWAHALSLMTFDEVEQADCDIDTAFHVLHLCHSWLRGALGVNLKSMNFLLSCGLF